MLLFLCPMKRKLITVPILFMMSYKKKVMLLKKNSGIPYYDIPWTSRELFVTLKYFNTIMIFDDKIKSCLHKQLKIV